jgi:hypothetical protein
VPSGERRLNGFYENADWASRTSIFATLPPSLTPAAKRRLGILCFSLPSPLCLRRSGPDNSFYGRFTQVRQNFNVMIPAADPTPLTPFPHLADQNPLTSDETKFSVRFVQSFSPGT